MIPVAPSSLPSTKIHERVHALAEDEVKDIIKKFCDAALRTKKADFDGVEVHAANGYLLCQFLSPFTNKRYDQYGGGYENRFRVIHEIVNGIKKCCGSDYPVCLRLSIDEYVPEGIQNQDCLIYSKLAEKAGVDAVSICSGSRSGGNIMPTYFKKPGFLLNRIAQIKKVLNIPVIGVGRINEPVLTEYAINNNLVDFVALGRQQVCDPDFIIKMKNKRENEKIKCLGCLQRCYYYSGGCEPEDKGISCMLNHFSGKESKWQIVPVKSSKRVVIIGAGVAGLTAAWILAKRGFNVTVYEKESTVGGLFKLAQISEMKYDFGSTINTFKVFCDKFGVKFKFNSKLSGDDVKSLNYDYLIISSGAKVFYPPIKNIKDAILATEVLEGNTLISNKKVGILGGGIVGCEVAEFLSKYGNECTVFEMTDSVCNNMNSRVKEDFMKKIDTVTFSLNSKVLSISGSQIIYEDDFGEKHYQKFDEFVLATGFKPGLKKYSDKDNIFYVGDAEKMGDANKAIYDATKLAINLRG